VLLESSEKQERTFLLTGSVAAFLAVAFGAFGAHALREVLPSDRLQIFETGVRYQFYHAFALIVAGFLTRRRRGRAAPAAGWLFAFGIVFFSGSLYVLALSGIRAWGAVTPIGGLAWLVAWILVAFSSARARSIDVEAPTDERPRAVPR
jgi:uncharacterized membrane protein YgdD (TMEM256/DUF423 family)